MGFGDFFKKDGGFDSVLKLGGMLGGAASSGASNKRAYKIYKQRKKAYEDLINRSSDMAATGEKQFLGEYANQPTELNAARNALLNRESESLQKASSQIGANLAQVGARGTQGALAQTEAVGDIANKAIQDIDLESYQDALRRRGAKGQFFGTKAATGQSGMLTSPSF